ncbi:hypothetical protein EXN66_Car000109 [Channa argus]|uniref:Uncharacterized protein n=1 Tax=Channa argus TaxID=215402 RepID=A0A6G1QXJ6_CHAAH|nr:hypothetical protein EXN66_Car000109 [Channa argus]
MNKDRSVFTKRRRQVSPSERPHAFDTTAQTLQLHLLVTVNHTALIFTCTNNCTIFYLF